MSQYFLTNKNTNIFGLTKKSEYKCQYIQFEEEKNANTNANIFELTKEDKYEKIYEYLDWYLRIQIQL